MLLLGIFTGLIVIDVLRLVCFIPFPVDNTGFLLRLLFLAGAILWGVRTLIYQHCSRSACLFYGRDNNCLFIQWSRNVRSAGYLSCIQALVHGVMKMYWSVAGLLGYVNREITLNAMHVGQLDFTAVLYTLGLVLALASIPPWGEKLPGCHSILLCTLLIF